MDKKELLKVRLDECGIVIDDIVEYVKKYGGRKYAIIVYISKFDGVGNNNSDFDVYVLTDDKIQTVVTATRINRASCDIEIWSLDRLLSVVNESKIFSDPVMLKLIKRLCTGLLVYSESDKFQKFNEAISKINVDEAIYKYFKVRAVAEYDDAVKMYKNGEFISSFMCSHRAIGNLIAAINAQNGHANMKIKWAPYVYINNAGFGMHETYDNYMRLAVYMQVEEGNVAIRAEEMIDFLTIELNRISLV